MRTYFILLFILICPCFISAQDSTMFAQGSAITKQGSIMPTQDTIAKQDSIMTTRDSVIAKLDKIPANLLDSVFTASGDTLIGKVSIDKDNDRFIFESKDTFTIQLLPKTIKKFTYNLVEKNGEKVTYLGILHDFYFLEFGEHSPMSGYVRYTYRPVEDDGPKYHVVTKKYCYFKGKVPFFPRQESFKSDLLLLIDDCPKVVKTVQFRDIKIEEITKYVLDYNNCNGKIKK
jgi:hypothetical protein